MRKIKIKIHPKSSKEEIKRINDDAYEIWIGEKAENNRANLSVVKALKKYFNSEIRIISGFKSRNKIVEI